MLSTLLIFVRNENLMLNNCGELFCANQNNFNDYCFTMPMENGRVVDLNLPQIVSIIFK